MCEGIQTKKFDEYEVKEWIGHTKIQTTMNYIQYATFYYKKVGYEWIKRVLNCPRKKAGENLLK